MDTEKIIKNVIAKSFSKTKGDSAKELFEQNLINNEEFNILENRNDVSDFLPTKDDRNAIDVKDEFFKQNP